MDMLELRDTIDLMNSADYKDRFAAEYWQTKIRYHKLHKMLIKAGAGTLTFEPTCTIELLNEQKKNMGNYLHCLEIRAEIEGIDLEAYATIMRQMRTEGRCKCAEEGET